MHTPMRTLTLLYSSLCFQAISFVHALLPIPGRTKLHTWGTRKQAVAEGTGYVQLQM